MVPGWRGRIGVVYPDDGVNDDEFWKYLPDGVTLLITRYRAAASGTPITPDMVATYADLDVITGAARTLTVTRPVAVTLCCNSCSFIAGPHSAQRITSALTEATGAPASTTTTAQIAALQALGVHRVAIGAPYQLAVTKQLADVLDAHGFSITGVEALGMESEWHIGNSDPGVWYRLARTADTPDAQAVILACGGIRTATILTALEADLGKPVVSAPAVSMWHALRLAGINDRRDDRGLIFKDL